MIGANCMKALKPTRIINSEGGGPYAYKTRLGWRVVGPINCISKGITTTCNRVAVRDVASSKLASHHFAMEKSIKDVSLKELFQAMYRHDFNEPEHVKASTMLKCGEVSHEDQKFMEIVDRGTSKKNHVVPMPFGDPSLMLPNNRIHAILSIFDRAQKKIYEGQQIPPRLSQLYGQSVKKWPCKKVRCITSKEDLVYPSPWSASPY